MYCRLCLLVLAYLCWAPAAAGALTLPPLDVRLSDPTFSSLYARLPSLQLAFPRSRTTPNSPYVHRLSQAGLLSPSPSAEWRGTAPLCSGACAAGETEVLRGADTDSVASLEPFGAPCTFGTSKVLCAPAAAGALACSVQSRTLRLECAGAMGSGLTYHQRAYYTGCTLIGPGALCADAGPDRGERALGVVRAEFVQVRGAWGASGGAARNAVVPGPYVLEVGVTVGCCS
ncbi:hypothetical protein CALCODRAFT_168319 [Calocera cornea HHB12733]|uniref:Uncharacterized protein n=1 Tax=Calocera cornea HHB12733 TaxID=1353952 RepID=A0A165CHI1_9BASI|nr:hypothetical protein CALCODRAFT_168319 [Calocera cornea HHB12733]